MKIYTKTGDKGLTTLGSGERVPKYALRVETYGAVDELHAFLGAAVAQGLPSPVDKDIKRVMNELFSLCADLSNTAVTDENARIQKEHIVALEKNIDAYMQTLPQLTNFILQGGSKGGSMLHVGRAVCRRAERLCVNLVETENNSSFVLKYLNRLSDFLFTAARMANYLDGAEEVLWQK
jgi:cob(I)alamin adenosyltransferase